MYFIRIFRLNIFNYLNRLPIKNKARYNKGNCFFYGDANINEDRLYWQQDIGYDDNSHRFIDDDNNIIFEEDKAKEISF